MVRCVAYAELGLGLAWLKELGKLERGGECGVVECGFQHRIVSIEPPLRRLGHLGKDGKLCLGLLFGGSLVLGGFGGLLGGLLPAFGPHLSGLLLEIICLLPWV